MSPNSNESSEKLAEQLYLALEWTVQQMKLETSVVQFLVHDGKIVQVEFQFYIAFDVQAGRVHNEDSAEEAVDLSWLEDLRRRWANLAPHALQRLENSLCQQISYGHLRAEVWQKTVSDWEITAKHRNQDAHHRRKRRRNGRAAGRQTPVFRVSFDVSG